MISNLRKALYESFIKNLNNNCIIQDKKKITYENVLKNTFKITHLFEKNKISGNYIGIIGENNFFCYFCILACIFSCNTYVFINSKKSQNQISKLIIKHNIKYLFISSEHKFNKKIYLNLNLVKKIIVESDQIQSDEKIINFSKLIYDKIKLSNKKKNLITYILFTSGTTGEPKAIPISEENLLNYINIINKNYNYKSNEVISQTFDLSFDLSIHCYLMAFLNGGTLLLIKNYDILNLLKIFEENKVSRWFSVPSTIRLIKKFHNPKFGKNYNLKHSLFCGEALYYSDICYWKKIFPNSKIDNLYGPTECTIAISKFRVNDLKNLKHKIPIGKIFKNHRYKILNEKKNKKKIGELLISGKQVFKKYLNDPTETKRKFITINNIAFYKTGDLVSIDKNNDLIFHGRIDNQIKFKGHRIELQEIESILNKKFKTANIVATAFTEPSGIISSIKIVTDNKEFYKTYDVLKIKKILPSFLNLNEIIFIQNFPLGFSGKLDRKKILKIVKKKLN